MREAVWFWFYANTSHATGDHFSWAVAMESKVKVQKQQYWIELKWQ